MVTISDSLHMEVVDVYDKGDHIIGDDHTIRVLGNQWGGLKSDKRKALFSSNTVKIYVDK